MIRAATTFRGCLLLSVLFHVSLWLFSPAPAVEKNETVLSAKEGRAASLSLSFLKTPAGDAKSTSRSSSNRSETQKPKIPQETADSGESSDVASGSSGVLTRSLSNLLRSIPYPPLARQMSLEGLVWIRSRILPDGTVASTEILQSSGYDVLDRAAREGISSWHFPPTQTPRILKIPVRFRLVD